MLHLSATLRRILLTTGVCLMLFVPRADAGGHSLFADFDGDGHRDRVSIDQREPSVLRVWLSKTRSIHIIHSAQPVREVTAVDLNGDRRPELVAIGGSSGLLVWTKGHTGFRTFRHKHPSPIRDIHPPERRRIDDDPEDPGTVTSAGKPTPQSLIVSLHRRPPPAGASAAISDLTFSAIARLPIAAFAPRPPPLLPL